MQSNKYVYPSQPYQDLTNINIVDNMAIAQTINQSEVRTLLNEIPDLNVSIHGDTIEEKILSIFLDDAVRFGPREYITDQSSDWIKHISYFTEQNIPLQCTILGFPFKMMVPLKTNRVLPDMGELLSLHRLRHILDMIQEVYAPGAVLTVFTEGGLGPAAGVPQQVWDAYDASLKTWVKELGWEKEINIEKLSNMESFPNFKEAFDTCLEKNAVAFESKDERFMEKYAAVFDVVFRLTNSSMYTSELLAEVYNTTLTDSDVSDAARAARESLRVDTHDAIMYYFSYLAARDAVQFLQTTVPHTLQMSVSPKPGRLGVTPIHTDITVLPYHGVPTYMSELKKWDVVYLYDIVRDTSHTYTPVHVEDDTDQAPFYYRKV